MVIGVGIFAAIFCGVWASTIDYHAISFLGTNPLFDIIDNMLAKYSGYYLAGFAITFSIGVFTLRLHWVVITQLLNSILVTSPFVYLLNRFDNVYGKALFQGMSNLPFVLLLSIAVVLGWMAAKYLAMMQNNIARLLPC